MPTSRSGADWRAVLRILSTSEALLSRAAFIQEVKRLQASPMDPGTALTLPLPPPRPLRPLEFRGLGHSRARTEKPGIPRATRRTVAERRTHGLRGVARPDAGLPRGERRQGQKRTVRSRGPLLPRRMKSDMRR
jgi:hypothetical protein